jgi:hypothetical protein
MADDKAKTDQCKTDIGTARKFRDEIPAIVEELALTMSGRNPFRRGRPSSTPYTWRAAFCIPVISSARVWMRSTWDTISARS